MEMHHLGHIGSRILDVGQLSIGPRLIDFMSSRTEGQSHSFIRSFKPSCVQMQHVSTSIDFFFDAYMMSLFPTPCLQRPSYRYNGRALSFPFRIPVTWHPLTSIELREPIICVSRVVGFLAPCTV